MNEWTFHVRARQQRRRRRRLEVKGRRTRAISHGKLNGQVSAHKARERAATTTAAARFRQTPITRYCGGARESAISEAELSRFYAIVLAPRRAVSGAPAQYDAVPRLFSTSRTRIVFFIIGAGTLRNHAKIASAYRGIEKSRQLQAYRWTREWLDVDSNDWFCNTNAVATTQDTANNFPIIDGADFSLSLSFYFYKSEHTSRLETHRPVTNPEHGSHAISVREQRRSPTVTESAALHGS